jgi:hypothetical protein
MKGENMTLRKTASSGHVMGVEGPLAKTAARTWDDDDDDALQEENEQADADGEE